MVPTKLASNAYGSLEHKAIRGFEDVGSWQAARRQPEAQRFQPTIEPAAKLTLASQRMQLHHHAGPTKENESNLKTPALPFISCAHSPTLQTMTTNKPHNNELHELSDVSVTAGETTNNSQARQSVCGAMTVGDTIAGDTTNKFAQVRRQAASGSISRVLNGYVPHYSELIPSSHLGSRQIGQ